MPCVLPAWFCGGCWTDVGGVLLRKNKPAAVWYLELGYW